MLELTPYEIAHRGHLFCSPMTSERAGRLVSLLDLPESPSMVDLCCGKAELLLRLVEQTQGLGLGVDLSRAFITEGQERAATRGISDRVRLVCSDVNAYPFEPGSHDLAMRIGGADHAGAFGDQVARLRDLVRPGGSVLIADVYWRKEPPAERFSPFMREDGPMRLEFHAEKAAILQANGLDLLYTMTSTEDEWDHYEGLCIRAVERWAVENPGDPRRESVLARARDAYGDYLAWRREYLGFGFYLARRP